MPSASNSCSAVGLCMAKAGSDSAGMKPAKGWLSSIVTDVSPSGVHDL
jgi:hypothetical protein